MFMGHQRPEGFPGRSQRIVIVGSVQSNGSATGQGVVGAAKLGHAHVTLTSPSPIRPNQRALPLNKDWVRAGSGGSVHGRDVAFYPVLHRR